MEANHDNDKLDKYVHDAFDGYEELPSDGMWDRIEAGLPPQQWAWTRRRWSVAAALAILILASGLIGQHLYYKDKIQELSARPSEATKKQEAAPSIATAPSSANKQTTDDKNPTSEIIKPAQDQASILNQDAAPEKKIGNTMVSKDSPGQPARGKPRSISDFGGRISEAGARTISDFGFRISESGAKRDAGNGKISDAGGRISEAGVSKSTVDAGGNDAASPVVSTATPVNKQENAAATDGTASDVAASAPNNIISDLALLPSGSAVLLPGKAPAAPLSLNPVAPAPIITPAPKNHLWYVGVRAAPGLSTEKIPEPDRPLPPWGGGPRKPEVVNERETTVYTTDWWLTAGRKLGRRFSIETGIGYRNIERVATHKPHFEFRDGHPQPGGPHGGGGGKCFDFDYQLEAYGGTASVSLRMTQVDSGINVSDKEPIKLEIKTSQQAQVLRVPLVAGVRARMGRFDGQLKVGLVGNFVLNNQLTIEGLNSLNNKFQPEQPAKPQQDFASPRTFIPGYWASAALEYRLGKHLSAVIEPAITGDFSTQNKDNRPLPRDFSAALNVGLNYYF